MNIYEKDELAAMIPSKDVRQHIIDTGYTFNDWQKAALLYHNSESSLKERHARLCVLKDQTDDTILHEQIESYLEQEESAMQMFRENNNKDHVYILTYEKEGFKEVLYFFDWKIAHDCGMKRKVPFTIEKHLVNAHLIYEETDDICYEDAKRSCMEFDSQGNAELFMSFEYHYKLADDNDFQNMYFEIPHPFKNGDIVKLVGSEVLEDRGIIEYSEEHWRSVMEKYRNGILPLDSSDVQMRVVCLNDDGEFAHSHIYIPFLERYEPKGLYIADDASAEEIADSLLLTVRAIYRGEGSLEDLNILGSRYRNINK